jgi:molybdopterin-containing oxidoreductase family membrane subunit
MWFERFVIIVTSLHRDYLTSSWTMYKPTIVEFGLLIGTLGIFFTAFLLFIRVFPVISISEVKSIMKTGDQHQHKTDFNHEKTE